MYLNRTLCSVLSEMRACHKTRNYTALSGLIEEVQGMGNRMESAIGDLHQIETVKKEWHKWKKKSKKLPKKTRSAIEYM